MLLALMLAVTARAEEGVIRLAQDCAPFPAEAAQLCVRVCDLAGGDCLLLDSGGQCLLVDCGKENQLDCVTAMLEAAGIRHIDAVFSTHPHRDHLGGLPGLLERFTVGRFYTVFPEDAAGFAMVQYSAVRALREKGVPIEHVTQGDMLELGAAEVTVYHQPQGQSVNAQSGMLHVRFGKRSMLLGADVTGLTQQRFGERFDLAADILKYPHHGLDYLARPFLESVRPGLAILTNGVAGSERAQAQLGYQRIPYRFATWGVITLTTDGSIWQVAQDIPETLWQRAREHHIPAEDAAE